MDMDRDFSEFIASCIDREVRFLVVDGYAVAAHGRPRYTKDLDIWIWPDPRNVERLLQALDDFGFASLSLTASDFTEPGTVIQLGYPPKRIDLLNSADGVDFESAWERRIEVEANEIPVPIISLHDLVTNKLATARLQDLADVEALRGEDDAGTSPRQPR